MVVMEFAHCRLTKVLSRHINETDKKKALQVRTKEVARNNGRVQGRSKTRDCRVEKAVCTVPG